MARKKLIPVNDREIPFKLSAQSVGVQRAYQEMVSFYGVTEGRRIFLARANELGVGNTIRQRAHSTYTTGKKLTRRVRAT